MSQFVYCSLSFVVVSVASTTKIPGYLDEGQDLILRKDGIASEDVEAILSNLYQQNQKIEKEITEFRAVAMKQSEAMEKNDRVVAKLEYRINKQDREMKALKQREVLVNTGKVVAKLETRINKQDREIKAMKQREVLVKIGKVVAKLESRINKQDREMVIMKQEIRKLRTEVDEKGTMLKQVLQENKKCFAELRFAKQSMEYIERVVNVRMENAPRKAIIQNSKKVNFSQNKKIESSSGETNQVLDKITPMRTGINVSKSEMQGDDNVTTLRKDINKVSISDPYEGGIHIKKQLRNGKGLLAKRDIVAEGVAFSAYLDHTIKHIGPGHTIKCNQVLLNDGNHYNYFTGILTVPQTGVYLLTFSFGVQNTNHWTEVRLVVNNREIVDAVGQVLGTFQRSSSANTAMIRLNQGESVWLESIANDSEVVSTQGYRWTTFSGVLLY